MRRKVRQIRWALPLLAGIFGAFLAGAGPSAEEQALQREISGQVLRLHVVANSDSRQDQEQKLKVRDGILKMLNPVLSNAGSAAESRRRVEEHLGQVEEAARQVLREEDSSLPVEARLSREWFPERTYGEYTLPEGEYQALRVEIGQGEGHNWWCILYPGLCFTGAVRPVEEDGRAFQGVLTEEACDFILHPAETKIRFRWLPF
ncbi:MAG TPA: stage II sporulation protein R [Candidatus Pullilachnospira intestinigallinarum]|nr:stage II sporulation protein R [Candidatus Pullilachnospira intestinigallinarum]